MSSDVLKKQENVDTSGAHVDGVDIGPLRAAFEDYVNPEGDVDLHWQPAGYYAGAGVQQSWLDFQVGHAAAKSETADVGEPVAWMTLNDDGDPAMLFFDHAEAMSYCGDGEVPIELFSADQLAAAVAKERERCASIADSQHFGGDCDDEPMWTTCAARIASAIRAGEPSDG